ncbi:uncharacterized protein N7506_007358 [Penicillium brevicompactum]|uniref:uncharacterized protein n=1 Tax=Penicillium brevicompactum TaxID=5074 RepID=UPI002541441E|nr:uncharacterized protein N7506_007358 [Penicillium brevicompactum]KAJ5333575.1 hypothetical protein N7506_007358 [Penicillium brevicompactum]
MHSVKGSRVTKPKVKKARRVSGTRTRIAPGRSPNNEPLPLVERTNALSIEEFKSQYAPSDEKSNSEDTAVDIYSAATISTSDLEACLDLVEQTSGEAYSASSSGWSRPKKRKEMKLPDMKYLIVRGTSADEPSGREVSGFLSFMVTYEDGKEVVYCYEIHLSPRARGRGIGKMLMERMEGVWSGCRVGESNAVATRFYERLGYGVDEYSPGPRRLRNGTVKDPDYLILSKGLK